MADNAMHSAKTLTSETVIKLECPECSMVCEITCDPIPAQLLTCDRCNVMYVPYGHLHAEREQYGDVERELERLRSDQMFMDEYRAIVSELAGWHDEAAQIDTSPYRLPITKLLVGKRRNALDKLCSDAWEALNGGDDGA